MIGAMRFALAASALLITYIDPSEPNRYVSITYTILALYTVYSLLLYVCAVHQRVLLPASIVGWVDICWYVVLIGLSSGTNSVFFFFLFFAILVTAFQWGFVPGLCVTLVSVTLFIGIGLLTGPAGGTFDLNRFLLRATYLVVLGYMVAYWGEAEIAGKRRLALLKDVSALSNPRFGIDRTLMSIMEQLRAFYDAEACLLVMTDRTTGRHSVHRATGVEPGGTGQIEEVPEALAGLLLALPVTHTMLYRGVPRFWERWYDILVGNSRVSDENLAIAIQVSGVLAAESFVSVPLYPRGESIGRLYLTSQRRYAFAMSDVDFLAQVLAHTMPVLDNIRLIERLASDASEVERQRIVHDLHDSVVQTYIGFQMGLEAIRQKLASGAADTQEDFERLSTLTDIGITTVRCFMSELRAKKNQGQNLLSAIRRFAEKFADATGIAVQVKAAEPLPHIHDRLGAEVFQMVVEGLSNIRRHTSSTRATVNLVCRDEILTLCIANDNASGGARKPFTPRSITERAMILGGRVWVECPAERETIVIVEVPL
jgi:signal transduction histidine kinase